MAIHKYDPNYRKLKFEDIAKSHKRCSDIASMAGVLQKYLDEYHVLNYWITQNEDSGRSLELKLNGFEHEYMGPTPELKLTGEPMLRVLDARLREVVAEILDIWETFPELKHPIEIKNVVEL